MNIGGVEGKQAGINLGGFKINRNGQALEADGGTVSTRGFDGEVAKGQQTLNTR